MCRYIINGGRRLEGEVNVEGSKNAVLPILAASLINSGVNIIHNCPDFKDVRMMINIMEELGCKVTMEGETVVIDSKGLNNHHISRETANEMRSSIIFLGAVLSRMKEVVIPKPGGCDIGTRPVNLHKDALKAMGAEINDYDDGILYARANNLKGCKIELEYPSVGATENIMIAAVLAIGDTVIINAAREPEIIDLQNFLNAMGAEISGAGDSLIYIKGVRKEDLHNVDYTVIPDRIVAGTYMTAAAVTGGYIVLNNVIPAHIYPVIDVLKNAGCDIGIFQNRINIRAPERLSSLGEITTQPYPGFPTDMQSQIICAMTVAKGQSIMNETVFDCRYKHVEELMKMGAGITVYGNKAYITGVNQLKGALITSKDLRGGAALIIAGLNASGTTIIHDERYIERGYVDIEKKLAKVGADIVKV